MFPLNTQITRRQWIIGASSQLIPVSGALANRVGDIGEVVDLTLPQGTIDLDAWLRDVIRNAKPNTNFRLGAGIWGVRQIVLDQPEITLSGISGRTILRSTDSDKNTIQIRAPKITVRDLRVEGICEKPAPNVFALATEDGIDTSELSVRLIQFTSSSPALGFSNAVKLNPGCDRAVISNCIFERLWGDKSGSGYGVLCGAIRNARLDYNSGYAGPGRGRHLIYLSSGASDSIAAQNSAQGFVCEGLTVYAHDYQPPCVRNTLSNNRVMGCATRGGADLGAVSVYGNCQETVIADNVIENSGGSGIVLDGAESSKLGRATISGNRISDSAAIGIEVRAIRGVRIVGNTLAECSLAEPGVHPDIRLASDGKTPVADVQIENNFVASTRLCRSALQMNKTVPMPQNVSLRGNSFGRGALARIELNGVRPL